MAQQREVYRCSMCTFATPNSNHLQKHIYTVHRDDPNFHVYCSFCNRSFKKLSAYRKHLFRGCKAQHTIESTYVQDDEDSEPENFVQPTLNVDESCTSQRSEETHLQLDKKWLEARYILGLKEKYSITQTAIDHVVLSTASLLSSVLDSITAGTGDSSSDEALLLIKKGLMLPRICSVAFNHFIYKGSISGKIFSLW